MRTIHVATKWKPETMVHKKGVVDFKQEKKKKIKTQQFLCQDKIKTHSGHFSATYNLGRALPNQQYASPYL